MLANMNVLGKDILTYNWILVYSYLFLITQLILS